MPNPSTTTTASAEFAPRTAQEISNLIERLVQVKDDHPPRPELGENYLMLDHLGHSWSTELPDAWHGLTDHLAISESGMLYCCDGNDWRIISDGLFQTLNTQPYTYGFAMMDHDLITEHIRSSVHRWLKINFRPKVGERAMAAFIPEKEHPERENDPLKETRWKAIEDPDNHPSSPDLVSFTAEVDSFFAGCQRVLMQSDNFGIRSSGLDVMEVGCRQALSLVGTMIQESGALCSHAVNPSPQGGLWPPPSLLETKEIK
jgi:hypothetical protein